MNEYSRKKRKGEINDVTTKQKYSPWDSHIELQKEGGHFDQPTLLELMHNICIKSFRICRLHFNATKAFKNKIAIYKCMAFSNIHNL